jgi:hypothetical protein
MEENWATIPVLWIQGESEEYHKHEWNIICERGCSRYFILASVIGSKGQQLFAVQKAVIRMQGACSPGLKMYQVSLRDCLNKMRVQIIWRKEPRPFRMYRVAHWFIKEWEDLLRVSVNTFYKQF